MFLQLDRRLARVVARTSEPLLGQMRLAWWRDALRQDPGLRPRGDAVLDGISQHWRGRESALVALVDGWEVLIGTQQLGADAVDAFAAGRAAPFLSLAEPASGGARGRVEQAGRCWALVDAAAGISAAEERALFLDAARNLGAPTGRLPTDLRGLAVLEALARRSLKADGAPLMRGRGAALTALRSAIFLR